MENSNVNDEGLTFSEWRNAADYSVVNLDQYEAWKRGEDPAEHRDNPSLLCTIPD